MSAAGMFLCRKGFRVSRSKSGNHERPGRISECLPVQTQQTDLQPLVDSSYLVTVTLITLHSCPLRAAPTLSKSLTLPPSPSSLFPCRSARRVQWIQLVFIPLLVDELSVMVSLQHPSNTAAFLISGPVDREAARPL